MLCTDNKALMTLLKEHGSLHSQASSRIQHWTLTLSMYEWLNSTSELGNADVIRS